MSVFCTGCPSQPGSVNPVFNANIHVNIVSSEEHWSIGLGCYYTVAGTVYNSGNADAANVIVQVNLINSNSGNIRDSKQIAVGLLRQGASSSFTAQLDGDCGQTYRVTASTNY